MSTCTAKHEGAIARAVRIGIGAALLFQVFVGMHTAWGWLGVVPLLTGLAGTCPVYSVFGFNACPVPSRLIRSRGQSS